MSVIKRPGLLLVSLAFFVFAMGIGLGVLYFNPANFDWFNVFGVAVNGFAGGMLFGIWVATHE